MGIITVNSERKTIVPSAKARQWWFDLQPDDHADPRLQKVWRMKPDDARRIKERSSNSVTTDDTFGGRRMSFTMRLQGEDTIATTGQGADFRSKGWLKFQPDPQGSRITGHVDMESKGFAGVMLLLMGGMMKKSLEQDFQIHNEIMEGEWRKKPW